MTVRRFSADFLAALSSDAQRAPRERLHCNLHASYQDPCQRLFNAIGVDSYIRPHRHALDPKAETLIAVKGCFALLTFADDGAIREIVQFGTERYADGRIDLGVELPSGVWHTVIALEDGSVMLEIKAGPFEPGSAKEGAPWAPEEGTAEARAYLEQLRARAHALSSRPPSGDAVGSTRQDL